MPLAPLHALVTSPVAQVQAKKMRKETKVPCLPHCHVSVSIAQEEWSSEKEESGIDLWNLDGKGIREV